VSYLPRQRARGPVSPCYGSRVTSEA
jgi:hypothetical protein